MRSSQPESNSYGEAIKSTAVIGGSSLISIALGLGRSKALALLLGPSGVGVLGMYVSVAELAHSVAGFGLQSSGVRQIAESVGSGNEKHVAYTAVLLKRTALGLGVLGALAVALSAHPLSSITFGNEQQAGWMRWLALVVLFRGIAASHTALIQGLRRIADLARLNVISATLGTAISIAVICVSGTQGIVPSLVATAAATMLTAAWYGRKVKLPDVDLSWFQIGRDGRALLSLGFAFMVTAFLSMGAAYVIRIIVLRAAGLEAAGLYQAAWALGGLYVGFILQAMGADFYPRLTAISTDDAACNRLVNEQVLVSALLAGPGVMATLTFAPLVIAVLYSAEFGSAVILLRWICLGMMLRVVAWPMGFIVIAKGAQRVFMATEFAATVMHVGLAWLLVPWIGVNGAGMAFFGLYVWHTLLIYAVVRKLSGFGWVPASRRAAAAFLLLTAVVFGGFHVWPFWLATSIGLGATVGSGVYSARALVHLLPRESVPSAIRPWLLRLRLTAA
jgi:PST family polysaccharide transporter